MKKKLGEREERKRKKNQKMYLSKLSMMNIKVALFFLLISDKTGSKLHFLGGQMALKQTRHRSHHILSKLLRGGLLLLDKSRNHLLARLGVAGRLLRQSLQLSHHRLQALGLLGNRLVDGLHVVLGPALSGASPFFGGLQGSGDFLLQPNEALKKNREKNNKANKDKIKINQKRIMQRINMHTSIQDARRSFSLSSASFKISESFKLPLEISSSMFCG